MNQVIDIRKPDLKNALVKAVLTDMAQPVDYQQVSQSANISNKVSYVDVTEVSSSYYFGIEATSSGESRGFIAQTNYRMGNFEAFAGYRLTIGNRWSEFSDGSLQTLIKLLLSHNFKIFMFDTYQALFAWLAESV
jgi:hypothetical protein